MSNYTKTTDFEAKDSLPTGDSGKIIRGAEFETEFDAISTAIATKADTAGPTFTGTLTFETISDGTIGVTAFVDEDDMSSDSATLVPTQQSVKAYVDAQVTAQDLDFQADSGGALSIDLDSETLTFTGGTGIDTSGSGNAVTFAIDSTVATLTGTQTLTNKTLTSPDVNTPDIDGGTIDGATIATSDITVGTGKTLDVSSGTLTLANDQISGDKVEGGTIASTTITSLASTTVDTTNVEVTNIKAKDGTSAGSIADTTGVVTLASSVLTTTDINGGTIDGATIGATTPAAVSATTVSATGNITVGGTVDGRDVATDGTKLDGIEAGADVTDTTNVTAAGALMDSELTSEASVKALNQGVATTDSPTFAGVTVNGTVEFDGLSGTGAVSVTDILDQDDMSSNSATALATQQSIKAYVDSQVGANNELSEVLSNGNTTGGTDIAVGTGDDITFADSSKAIFGAGSDLQIYHDGSNNRIVDSGTGSLYIQGQQAIILANADATEFYATFDVNGASTLRYDNSQKLATTSTGIDVTGTVTADNAEIGTGGASDANAIIDLTGDTTYTDFGFRIIRNSGANGRTDLRHRGTGNFIIEAVEAASITFETSDTERMRIDSSGNVGIGTSSPEADLHIAKSASSSAGGAKLLLKPASAYGSIVNNDDLGQIAFGAKTSSIDNTNNDSVMIRGVADATWAASDYPTRLEFWTTTDGTASPSERMRIDSSGNVGIGNSNPSAFNSLGATDKLVVGDGTISNLTLFGTTYGSLAFADSDTSSSTAQYAGLIQYYHTDNSMQFYTGSTERMRIDSSGNVGIGTTSPFGRLSVDVAAGAPASSGNMTNGFTVHNSNGGRAIQLGVNETGAYNYLQSSYVNNANVAVNMAFFTGASERMRIDTSGNLLVGTTASAPNGGEGVKIIPAYHGTNKSWTAISTAGYQTETTLSIYSTAVTAYRFYVDAAGTISAVNTTITSLSDERAKENIRDLDDGLAKVMQLQPRKFDWKKGQGKDISNDRGFIAQEFEQVFPDMIEEWKDEAPEGEEPYKAVNANLIPTLVKAIQEQNELINDLRARVAQLEGEN